MNALADVAAEGRAGPVRVEAELDRRIAELTYDHACIMLYTSGTTGRPKGVVLLNRSINETSKNTATTMTDLREMRTQATSSHRRMSGRVSRPM